MSGWDDNPNAYDNNYAHYGDQFQQQMGADDDNEDISPDLWQESCWTIISAYFDERGLVRQQLDSFDEFVQIKVQRMVEETLPIQIVGEMTHQSVNEDEEPDRFEIKFDQIYLSVPTHWEKDGAITKINPLDARLRGLTYSAPLYVDVRKRKLPAGVPLHEVEENNEIQECDKKIFIWFGELKGFFGNFLSYSYLHEQKIKKILNLLHILKYRSRPFIPTNQVRSD